MTRLPIASAPSAAATPPAPPPTINTLVFSSRSDMMGNDNHSRARSMNIVHIITRLIIGGAQENTLLSCEGQHDRGHEVALITGPPIGPEGSLLERAQRYGYRVIVVNEMLRSILPVKDFRTYRRLIRLLKEIKPDVVHTHSSKAGILGRWAANRAKVPVIVHTIHGLAFTASTSRAANTVYRILERHAAPLTNK